MIRLAGLLLLLAPFSAPAAAEPPVLTINGDAVGLAEFVDYLGQERAATLAYFRRLHGVGDVDASFWQRRFGGEVPIEHATRRAIDAAIRVRMIDQLADRCGIPASTKEASFDKRLEQENATRSAARAAGQAVYGPTAYDARSFRHYEQSLRALAVERDCTLPALQPDEKEIERDYAAQRDARYRMPVAMQAEVLVYPLAESAAARTAAERLSRGVPLADVRVHQGGSPATGSDADGLLHLTSISSEGEDEILRALGDHAARLPAGKAKALALGASIYVVRVVQRGEEGYRPLSEVRPLIASTLRRERLQKMLASMASEAKIELSDDGLRQAQESL